MTIANALFRIYPMRSIKLNKQDDNDQSWGCALYKYVIFNLSLYVTNIMIFRSHDCTGEMVWTFRSRTRINPGFDQNIGSVKCWKAGTF